MTSFAAVGVAVADADRSAAFYEAVFGMVEVHRFDVANMVEVIVGRPGGGASLALMQYKRDKVPRHEGESIKLVFDGEDLAAVAAAIPAAGGSVFFGPEAMPQLGEGVVLLLAVDPDGYVIEVVQNLAGLVS